MHFRKPKLFLRILQVISASGFATILHVFWIMPSQLSSRFGGWLVGIIGRISTKQKLVKKNISFAMPNATDAQINEITRLMWQNLGMTAGEFPHMKEFYSNSDNSTLELVGGEYLEKLKNTGTVFFISGHFANWEVFAAVAARYGMPFKRFYRPSNNPFVEYLIQSVRKDITGGFIIKSNTRAILQHIKSGHNIGFLIDQKTRQGCEVMFFGKKTKFPSAQFDLALRYNIPVLMARCQRLGAMHHRITVYPPMKVDTTLTKNEQIVDLTQQAATLMEEWIMDSPSDWLWLHDRWLLGKKMSPPAIVLN